MRLSIPLALAALLFAAGLHAASAEETCPDAAGAMMPKSAMAKSLQDRGYTQIRSLPAHNGCYEAKGDLPKAIEHLQLALDDKRISYRRAAITWKLALLNQKLNNGDQVKALCKKIIDDSTASDYRQKAENLLASLDAISG